MKAAKGKNKETLVMNGNLTISQVRNAGNDLHNTLKNAQNIKLDLESVKEVDLSYLQLLCSAHRTAINLGKTLAFKDKISEVLKKSIENNGFARSHGCALDKTNTCLWIMK